MLSAIAAAVMLAGCQSAPRSAATTSAATPAPLATASAVPVAANAKSCVPLSQIRESRVIDDRTIDFVLNNRTVLRNILPQSCPELGFERAFAYETSLSQLCSVDIITVIHTGGGPRRGASCGLGAFVPYTPVPPVGR